MTDQASQQAEGGGKSATGAEREGHEPSSVGQLNERTAKRQRMLLAGIATVILVGTSWIIFGSDHAKKVHQEGDAETIETASLVNRNLSQREFTTVYGNQLGAVIPGSRSPIRLLATPADSMPTRPLPRPTASMALR
ncbi:hypothetical protein [Novosphingobium sp. B1]|uniref:hypothetical protein n=1 Tax=Novosphingobium sp. B1 TaxID=1938756 RepID=UPI0009D81100|nr:hypothetical protein [Novosphingobium sp. B1]SMC30698.1 hypothetical protein SAMN06272759_101169 [Novosphingobium sp. B1]